jgi:hypothetical protein
VGKAWILLLDHCSCVRLFDLLWGSDPRVLMSSAPLRLIGLAASSCPGYRQVWQGTVSPMTHQPCCELARKDVSVFTRVRCSCLLNTGLVSQDVSVFAPAPLDLMTHHVCFTRIRQLGLGASPVYGNARLCGAGPKPLGPSCSPQPHRLYSARHARRAAESTYS